MYQQGVPSKLNHAYISPRTKTTYSPSIVFIIIIIIIIISFFFFFFSLSSFTSSVFGEDAVFLHAIVGNHPSHVGQGQGNHSQGNTYSPFGAREMAHFEETPVMKR